MVRGYNTNPITGGQGISIVAGVTGYQLVMCEGHDTGKGGIGPGKATKGIIALSRVYNTGAEGIPGDELSHCILLANIGHDTKGIGFLGMDRALNVIAVANLGYNNNNGFSCGDNKGDSQNLMVSSNIFVDNDHCGIWFKNKYARATITNITAPGVAPCVVTYQSLPVTGVSNALPCVMLVVGHGKTDGDRVIHHNIGGAGLGAALNNIEFCIKKIDNDHYYLLDTETLEPFDSTASGAYTAATGQMDHPFAHDDRQRLTGVTGMIQINYNPLTFLPQIQVGVATNTTVTLVNEDGTPFDTSLFTAYAGGGITERGGTAFNSGIHNNIVDGNNDYEIHTGWCQPQRVGNNLTVTGNQGPVAKNNFEGTPDHNGLNRNLDFDAGLTATKNNVTGDGTPYTIQFDQQYDNAGSYDPLTGIYLVQQDGHHWFETSVGITGIAGAATGKVEIQFYDRFGVLARTFRGNLAPNLGATEWRANVAGTMVLFRNMTVKVVITVTGLGLVGDMVSDGTSTFQGGLLH
jgi:hypothetical protein